MINAEQLIDEALRPVRKYRPRLRTDQLPTLLKNKALGILQHPEKWIVRGTYYGMRYKDAEPDTIEWVSHPGGDIMLSTGEIIYDQADGTWEDNALLHAEYRR